MGSRRRGACPHPGHGQRQQAVGVHSPRPQRRNRQPRPPGGAAEADARRSPERSRAVVRARRPCRSGQGPHAGSHRSGAAVSPAQPGPRPPGARRPGSAQHLRQAGDRRSRAAGGHRRRRRPRRLQGDSLHRGEAGRLRARPRVRGDPVGARPRRARHQAPRETAARRLARGRGDLVGQHQENRAFQGGGPGDLLPHPSAVAAGVRPPDRHGPGGRRAAAVRLPAQQVPGRTGRSPVRARPGGRGEPPAFPVRRPAGAAPAAAQQPGARQRGGGARHRLLHGGGTPDPADGEGGARHVAARRAEAGQAPRALDQQPRSGASAPGRR